MKPSRRLALVAVALIPFLVLVVLHWGYQPRITAGDYAQYLLHAEALLQGRPYSDIGYIYSSWNPLIGPRVQPPGLPLTLVPILATVGPSPVALKLLLVGSAIAFLLLSGGYVARRVNVWVGVGVTLMVGIALEAALATNNVISDLGFAALVWAVIVLADEDRPWSTGRIAAITFFGFAAIAYRTAGVALVPAMLLFALLRRGNDRVRALVPFVAWSAVLLVGLALLDGPLPFRELFGSGAREVWGRALKHAIAYPQLVLDVFLYPFPTKQLNNAYHVASAVLSVVGIALYVRRSYRSFLIVFGVMYTAMLIVAPVKEGRYVWPLFPVLALGFINGLVAVLRLVPPLARASRAPALAGAGVVLLAVGATVREVRMPAPDTLLGRRDVRDLFAYLRTQRATQPLRVIFVNPRVLTWETHVPAMALLAARPHQILAEARDKRITHFVVGDLGIAPRAGYDTERAVSDSADRFALVYRNPSFTVYRFLDVAPSVAAPSGPWAAGVVADPPAGNGSAARHDR